MENKFLLNITPRDYQTEIVEKCKEKNCLVVLPTGIGKTLIALMLTIDRMQKFPLEKVVFLAPTRPLAEQHFEYFKKHLPELFAQMDLFTGKIEAEKRKKIWQTSEIIFSTPQCIRNDLKKRLYDLSEVSLLIEDEAHRCVKNYSYTYVAKAYLNQAKNKRILGLTASPGTDKETIKAVCKDLSIEEVELRTRDSKDVKQYLQELDVKTIKIEFPKKFEEIRKLLKTIYDEKIKSLKNRNVLFGPPNKITLLECQKRVMRSIATGNKNFNLFYAASECAQAIKIHHAIELLETQTLYSLNCYFESLFEQAKANKSKAVKKLIVHPNFNKAYSLFKEMSVEKIEHPKLLELRSIIKDKISENPRYKAIIFSQYRDSVAKICKELNLIQNVHAKVFVGQTKKGESGLSQKEQKQIIDEFSNGDFNMLCATSIGEEGLDIPEVSSVIFYEPVPSAIRRIQRAGRTARLMPGELIMLITTGTKDETYHWSSIRKEKRMHKAIDDIKKDLADGKLSFKDNKEKQEKLF
ncbi:MAG: DEAD/DEAH box helicase [Candidatus Pacearchaeota archaeon]